MTGNLRDLVINLLAAILAFVAGIMSRWFAQRYRTRVSRRFWGSAIKGRVTFFLGSFADFATYEPSGVIGVGDARALQELTQQFSRLGVRDYRVGYANNIQDGELRANLVCFGGGDANEVSTRILSQIETGFTFLDDGVTIEDSVTHEKFAPQIQHGKVTMDYGIVVRAINPFDTSRRVLIIAGAYGFGTWAGVRILQDRDFLSAMNGKDTFAAIYETEVIQDVPHRLSCKYVRQLGHG